MAIDSPARLAILGAGPIGLEAALYARFLGYEIVAYEQGCVAEAVRRLSHKQMPAPFRLNHSSLGLAAIQAQDENYRAPDLDANYTYGQWIDSYLSPLAATDLVSGHLRLQTQVSALEMEELQTTVAAEDEEEARSFRILSWDAQEERTELFDGVLDCTGVANHVNWLGMNPSPSATTPFYGTSEPNYYILGSKSRGPASEFTFQEGLSQIREVFAILGDRATLDLYAGAKRLLR